RGLAPLLRTALAVGLGLAIAIGPIFIRNLAVAGDPVLIASQGGINLYIGNNPEADGVSAVLPEPLGFNWQIRDVVHIAEQAAGRPLAPGEVSDYWAQRARTWIAAHPLSFLRLYAEKLYWNISHREISNNRALGPFFALIPLLRYNPLSFGLLFALALAGLAAALRTNARLRLIALILLLYVAASALFFFNSRFRLPVLPLYFILAATGVFGLAEAVRRRRGLVLPAAALTVGAGLSFLPLVSLPSGVSPQAIMSAANYAYGQGDFRRALELSAEAAAVDSTYPEVNLNLGNAWLRLGDAAAARAAWEREARFHPGRPKALTNLASLALLEGRFADAQAEGQRALALRPYDYDANLVWLRAVFAADTTAPEQLVAEVQAAAARTGGDVYLLNEAGILLTQRGLAETARATLLAALSAPPPPIEMDDAAFAPNFRHSRERMREQHAQAAYQLGYLAALASRFGEAVEFSRRAVELDPGLAEAWVNLVGACAAAGRIDEARTTLREALARFPNRPELRELDRRLAPRQ
ncbi:MAG TPA: tetratricopeptide repeat protein, partial [candidate division Zixibacteria bacterium]|nr:tetratricopeptide repeat protein [candidate division Zixibacteria bacterium]